jgi:hypothetical protein
VRDWPEELPCHVHVGPIPRQPDELERLLCLWHDGHTMDVTQQVTLIALLNRRVEELQREVALVAEAGREMERQRDVAVARVKELRKVLGDVMHLWEIEDPRG